MRQTSRMLAVGTASRAGPLLRAGDTEGLTALLRELKRVDASIAYVVLADRDGEIVAHTFSWDPPEIVVRREREHVTLDESGFRRIEIEGESYLDVVAPVLAGTKGVGTLQVGVRAERRRWRKTSLSAWSVRRDRRARASGCSSWTRW